MDKNIETDRQDKQTDKDYSKRSGNVFLTICCNPGLSYLSSSACALVTLWPAWVVFGCSCTKCKNKNVTSLFSFQARMGL